LHRQPFDLVGHNGKALSGLAGSCCLDDGVESEEFGLDDGLPVGSAIGLQITVDLFDDARTPSGALAAVRSAFI